MLDRICTQIGFKMSRIWPKISCNIVQTLVYASLDFALISSDFMKKSADFQYITPVKFKLIIFGQHK